MTIRLIRNGFWWGLAIAPLLSVSLSFAAQAQPTAPTNDTPSNSDLPRFTSPSAPTVTQVPPGNVTVTRDQAPLPLGTVYQTPIANFEPAFSDVPTDHWAYEAVTRLFYSGIVSGY
ncbi:S-layer homology domain-containing protein [Oculatella sp. LEGE 06141]|uniref:S-layer homology domain-containing protein n=1 Tax=Oculatella sp. LEGE 06141 TaxID=1828648 RepID=UPI0018800F39|nr:S-layer homology domain-containing protein [Oculatella sp. LEGE 06141]MBE9182086.1 S-layer homology domain-containing protein [Oculatella sp. LEGE 06141]